MEEVNDNRDLDYLQADDKLESAGGKILDHCCWKVHELHSMGDREDTAGSNMKEEVVDQIIKGSFIQETVRICTFLQIQRFHHLIH